jgi:apolipoprotein N-acyltransferase
MSFNSIKQCGGKCAALYREKILSHAIHTSIRTYAILYFSGVCITLSLPPYFLLPLLPLGLSTLLLFIRTATSHKQRFLRGWWFGFGFFTTSIYWFAYALLVDAQQYGWLIPFAIGGIGGILALFYGISMLACGTRFMTRTPSRQLVWFALCLFAADWARGNLFSGFPWNLIGYTWTVTTTTIQLGAFFGIYVLTGLTIIVMTTPALLFIPIQNEIDAYSRKKFIRFVVISVFILASASIARIATAPLHYDNTVKLRLVQGNIPQSLKWDPQGRLEGIRAYTALSMTEGHDSRTHIIWPESAMTYAFDSQDYWAKELSSIVPEKGLLLTGTIRKETYSDTDFSIFNSLQGLDSHANVVLHYNKRHLVPFGEYVPLRNILPVGKITHGTIDFTSGAMEQPINTPSLPAFQPIICYESIFPELARDTYPKWLLLITNDAWFGDSSAPYQHLQMGRMRAVEHGVPLIRAANTGISAVIDGYGRILQTLPLNQEGVLDTDLPKPTPTPTPINRYEKLIYFLFITGCIAYTKSLRK